MVNNVEEIKTTIKGLENVSANDLEYKLLELKAVLSRTELIRSMEMSEFLYQGITHQSTAYRELAYYLLEYQSKDQGSSEFLVSHISTRRL